MASTKLSADLPAPAELIYDLATDPSRLPDWDVTYEEATRVVADSAGESAFEADRTLANRGMHLVCRVVRSERPTAFAFTCDGGHGERVEEVFELSPSKDGGTRFSREVEFELPGQDLGVIPDLTFGQAWLDRSVEQAFARLSALLGTPGQQRPVAAPGDAETRSEDSGPITGEEPYSAHPGSPRVPDRPT